MYDNKIKMTLEDNIFLAKRDLVDSIWKQTNLEGYAVTFPETATVVDGFSASGMSVNSVITINNLKRAWYFIIDNIEYEPDIRYISQVNKIIGGDQLINRAGLIRNKNVEISGTNWIPKIPTLEDIEKNLDILNAMTNDIDRALKTMLYLMKSQLFIDGNKITAQLIANQILIQNGRGIVSIPIEIQDKFRNELVYLYETNKDDRILKLLKDKCLKNLDLRKENFIDPGEWIPPKKKGKNR